MPPSWFDGYADPLNEHPLFLHYLPELRTRANIPAVNVRTDEELEPDGYRIVLRDQLVETGQVDRDFLYLTPAARDLLSAELAEMATDHAALELMRIPRSAVAEDERLPGLLSVGAEEYVCRRLAEVARAFAGQLEAAPA
jgi:hypothetical protein